MLFGTMSTARPQRHCREVLSPVLHCNCGRAIGASPYGDGKATAAYPVCHGMTAQPQCGGPCRATMICMCRSSIIWQYTGALQAEK